ncbi:MAG: hypothetical protein ACI8S7_001757, partial [Candidatus Krumholzibacteriia bacterium]
MGLTFYFSPPYVLPDGNVRASGYGFNGTPSVVFDGTEKVVGGAASGSMFSTYESIVLSQLSTVSPLSIDASYVIIDGQVTLTTDIDVDLATSGSSRQVMFFVTQDDLHGHPNMVMAMLPEAAFSLTAPGQSTSIERTFPMSAAWNEPDLNIMVVVQNTATKEIYQAFQAIPDYAGTVTLDCDPNGLNAAWTCEGPGFEQSGFGDSLLNVFAAGQYTVTWENVAYWDGPVSPQVETLIVGGAVTFAGDYSGGPLAATTSGAIGSMAAAGSVSLIDFDSDGDLDVHVTSHNSGDMLLENDGLGTFNNLNASPLAATSSVRGAAWADVNGDGAVDVYLTRENLVNQLFLADGNGGFTQATKYGDSGADPSYGGAWIDFDNDGLLDLSVVNNGAANVLLKSQGEIAPGTLLFSSLSGAFGNLGAASCIVWGDGDLDGRPDPYVVNQFSGNVVFQNTTVGFSDLTGGLGMGDLGNGKGAAFGDFDNDGDLDLYLANDGQADVLYKCTGPFQYTQVGGPNMAHQGRGRGVLWADFDNDGNLDLFLSRYDESDVILLGDGMGNFTAVPVGLDEGITGSNACACGDMNNDGKMDIVVTRESAANVMFTNQITNSNHWVQLHLTGNGTNTGGIGARVVLAAGGKSQTRFLSPGSGYLSCSAIDPHFGLGAATVIDQIDIYWPDGLHQTIGSQGVDRILAITKGVDLPSAVDDGQTPHLTSLGAAYPNPFNPSTTINFVLKYATEARVDVYTVDGRHVRTLTDTSFGSGPHQVMWQGDDDAGRAVASGTYLFRLKTADGYEQSGSM